MSADSILVKIQCDTREIQDGIKKANASLNSFQKVVEDTSQHFNGFRAKIAVLGLALQGFEKVGSWAKYGVAQFAGFGDQLDKMSIRTGIAAKDISSLKFAAEQTGAGFDELSDAVKTFQEQIGAAKLGDAGAIGKLGDVGIRAEDMEGLSSQEQFLKIADHISQITDRSKQSRVAIELFGEAGYKLLPMFRQGKAGIQEMMEEAEKLGITMGEEDVASAIAMNDEINRLKSTFSSMVRQGIAAIANPLIQGMAAVRQFSEGLVSLIKTLRPILNIFISLSPAIMRSVVAFYAVSKSLALATVITKLYNGMVLLAAGIKTVGIQAIFTNGALKTMMLTNPIGWVALLVSAFVGLGSAILGAKAELQDFEEEKQKAAETAEQETAAISTKLDRLKELSAVEERTRSEQREMEVLLRQLAAAGMDANKIYDEQTGKLSKLADGYEALKKSAKWKEAKALEAANAEIMRNLKINNQNMAAKGNERSVSVFGSLLGWKNKKQLKALEEMEKKDEKLVAKFKENLQKIDELRAAATQEDEEDKRILEEREKKKKLIEESQKTNITVDSAILQASFVDDRAKELYENEQKYAKLRADTETSLAALDVQRDSEGKLSKELQKKYDAYQEFYGKLGELEYQAMTGIHEKYAAKEQEAIRKELEKTEAAARKKEEEARKTKEENTQRLIELQNQLMDASLTASQRELQAIQKINAELEERLQKENNLTESQKKKVEEALQKNRDRETSLVDSKLDPAQAQFLSQMDQLQQDLSQSREEYLKALEQSGFQEDSEKVQKAKAKMESSENAIQAMSLQGAQSRVTKLQEEFQTKKDALANAVDTHERLRLTDELAELRQELQSARDSVWTLQNSDAQKQIQESGKQLEKEETQKQFTVSSNGTFSAYGLDSVAGGDIPKQSLDQLKKICQTVLSIHSQKIEEGFVV